MPGKATRVPARAAPQLAPATAPARPALVGDTGGPDLTIAAVEREASPEAVTLAATLAQARAAIAASVRQAITATVAAGGGEAALARAIGDAVAADADVLQLQHAVGDAQCAAQGADRDAGIDHVAPEVMQANLAVLSGRLGEVRATLPAGGGSHGYAGTAALLQDRLGAGRARSAGAELFVAQIAGDAADYLGQALAQPTVPGAITIETLSARLAAHVESWGTTHGLLELELRGTLADVSRAELEARRNDTGDDERAAAGRRLGEASRLALLIRAELARVERRDALAIGDAGDGRSAAGLLAGLDDTGTSEDRSLDALDGNQEGSAGLLAPQQVGGRGGRTILPEHAFPAHTDAASRQFLDQLAARVQQQEETLAALFEAVVPDSQEAVDFIDVYDRWFQFYSPDARDEDPDFRFWTAQYETLFDAFAPGPMGVSLGMQAGLMRGVFMELLAEQLGASLGGAALDFAGEIKEGGLTRDNTVSGSAARPEYAGTDSFAGRSADQFASDQVGRRSLELDRLHQMRGDKAAGELTAKERQEEAARAAGLGLIDRRAIARRVVLLDEAAAKQADADAAWRYVLTTDPEAETAVGPGGVTTDEEKAVSPAVYRYLLALAEHLKTVNELHVPHADGKAIGDAATRKGGVEAAEPDSTERWVEGKLAPTRLPAVESDKQGLERAWHRQGDPGSMHAASGAIDPMAGSGMSPETQAMLVLTAQLERYLDAFVAGAGADPVTQMIVTMHVAEREHGLGQELREALTAEAFVKELATEAAIAGGLWALSRMGAYGFLLSEAIGKGLELTGKAGNRTTIATLLFWFSRVLRQERFVDARTNAYLLMPLVPELSDLVLGELAGALVELAPHTRTLLARIGKEDAATPEEIAEIMADPKVAKETVAGFETRLREVLEPGGDPPPEAYMIMSILRRVDKDRHAQLLAEFPALAGGERGGGAEPTARVGDGDAGEAIRASEAYEANGAVRDTTDRSVAARDHGRTREQERERELVRQLQKEHGLDAAEARALYEATNKRSTTGKPLVGRKAIEAHFRDASKQPEAGAGAADARLPDLVVQRRDGMYVGVEATTAREVDIGVVCEKFAGLATLAGEQNVGRFEIYIGEDATFTDKLYDVDGRDHLVKGDELVRFGGALVVVKRRSFAAGGD
jgi:hypothetical protein